MKAPDRPQLGRWRAAGCGAVMLFAILVLRFWHPVYGFTRFLQLDAANDSTKIAAFREQPIYVYRNTGGYDGQYYAQIAYHPLLKAPELKAAVDNLSYRARRILPAAAAWAIAAGRESQIARVYAWLNAACWLALAGMTWRMLAVSNGKTFLAWFGILFSAGALTSVRFALTDLIAATLTLMAMGGVRCPNALGPTAFRSRTRARPSALGTTRSTLALAALSRETALLALPGIWRRPWLSRQNLLSTLVAVLPLGLWLVYVYFQLGPGDPGLGNFTWPLLGWARKWIASVQALAGPVDFVLTFSTLLAVAGLTVQSIYCVLRPRWNDAWWRVALAYLVLLAFLGQAVWEDYPGAAFRAVLPLTLACNFLMARDRAGWAWLVGGNLGIVAGLVALGQVPTDPSELGAGAAHGQKAIVGEGAGWFGAEHTTRHSWAWASGPATMNVQTWPGKSGTLHCAADLRSLLPRRLVVKQGVRVCWSGAIGPIKIPAAWDIDLLDGHAVLQMQTDGPAVPESADAHARALAFGVYDLKVSFRDVRPDPH